MHLRRLASRRVFIGSIAASAGLASAGGAWKRHLVATGDSSGATGTATRADHAYRIRHEAALNQKNRSLPLDATNGDDDLYPSRFASYSKGLPHDDRGEVDPAAYTSLLSAVRSGRPAAFSAIPLGGTLKHVNPQAAYTFTLQGADSHHVDLRAAPAFASAEAASDMAEVYWHAVLRDVAFTEYPTDATVAAACRDLARLSDFRGPKQSGGVTPTVLFRGTTAGDLVGPYISQFLYASVPHGVFTLEQRFRMPTPGVDYMTHGDEWLAIQRGSEAARGIALEFDRRYLRTGRDLARYVHRDYTFEAFLNAALLLTSLGESYVSPSPYNPRACSAGAELRWLATEAGFSTFGPAQILDAVAAVANLALRATWRQKWLLHRRLRPEAFAHRVDRAINHGAEYPIHVDLRASSVRDFLAHDNLLLPMAYPEGAPAHPSYPAGHAAIAGACATVLKAFFREDAVFPGPVRPSIDGLSLLPVENVTLTIGGELDKLASNISIARDFAGLHYRSDAREGMRLGEAVATAYLADMRRCLTEEFDGFSLTTFGGEPVTV